MLPTIRGRCAEYELKRPGVAELVDNLIRVAAGEGWTLDSAVAKGLVEYSDPALGVRGTLMGLEKLSGALSAGDLVSVEALSGLLGEAPVQGVERLWVALCSLEAEPCFSALDELRMTVPEEVIRSALVTRARRALGEALGSGSGLSEASWRYRSLVGAAKGAAWTEVALLALLAPQVAWDGESAQAMTERIEAAIARLDELGAWRGDVGGPTGHVPTTREVAEPAAAEVVTAEPEVDEVGGETEGDETEIWGQVGVVAGAAGTLPKAAELFEVVAPEPVSDDAAEEMLSGDVPVHEGAAAEFLEVAGERCTRMVVAALRSCAMNVDETTAVVSGPDPLIARLSAPAAYADLLETAADMGVTLQLVGA
jgi:hypothetical protein